MNGFSALKAAFVCAMLLAGLGCSLGEPPARPPNFIFILTDDQGWADVGFHGSQIQTPTLDGLASSGVIFTQHYVQPECSPTRAALLTGRFPSRFGIDSAIAGKSTQHLPEDNVTLPGILARCGYKTHLSGKWHLGLRQEWGPTRYGFQTSYGYLHGQVDPLTHLYKFGDRTWHRNDQFIDEEGHATDLITADAVRFIDSARGGPFFLYVAYSVPHYPLSEPEEWTRLYEEAIPNPSRRLYAASLTHMDHGVGQIVEALERNNLRTTTLIVFSSDNGGQDSWGAPVEEYEGRFAPNDVLGDNGPLRGWKTEVYEGGIRVPAFASWPGTLGPAEVDQPIHIVDWLPTFATLADCRELPPDLDGRDLSALLSSPASPLDPRPIYIRASSASALRTGEWKLIEHPDGTAELYNIASDPFEKVNLAEVETRRLADMRALLAQQKGADGEGTF